MPALFSPQQRRGLARRNRWLAVLPYTVAAFFTFVVIGVLGANGTETFDGDAPPAGTIAALVVFAALVAFLAFGIGPRLIRIARAWHRAATVDPPPVVARGFVAEMTHRNAARSRLDITLEDGRRWQLRTETGRDDTTVPGDPVTVELYGHDRDRLGAYRNERTAHVHPASIR